MRVEQKFAEGENFDSILRTKLTEAISNLSNENINEFVTMMNNEIRDLGIGKKVDNVLEYNHSFYCNGELRDFLISGAKAVVDYVMEIHIRQIALFRLMNVGVLMPVSIKTYNKIQLDLNHSHGNTLFNLFMDILPYDQFLIVQLPAEGVKA